MASENKWHHEKKARSISTFFEFSDESKNASKKDE
jgi:hypothetical protein